MLVIVRRSLVSLSRQVGVGMIMWSRGRIVEVRRIDRSVRAVMLMLVFVRMLVRVSVRMAVHNVAVGVGVVRAGSGKLDRSISGRTAPV